MKPKGEVKTKSDVKIAGELTVSDWEAIKDTLVPGKEPDNWKLAYKNFFLTRLETRYFQPIKLLQKNLDNKGEGFSIVALQCSLIEFFASTLKGESYKHSRPKKCGDCDRGTIPNTERIPHTYSNSSTLFINFLRFEVPFKDHYSRGKAEHFYDNVRCALLHEARTKGGWIIRAGDGTGPPIHLTKNIVYRDNFQSAFDEFVSWYGEELPKCDELQKAFHRKFESLCIE